MGPRIGQHIVFPTVGSVAQSAPKAMRENRVRNDPGAEFSEEEKRRFKKHSDFVLKRGDR